MQIYLKVTNLNVYLYIQTCQNVKDSRQQISERWLTQSKIVMLNFLLNGREWYHPDGHQSTNSLQPGIDHIPGREIPGMVEHHHMTMSDMNTRAAGRFAQKPVPPGTIRLGWFTQNFERDCSHNITGTVRSKFNDL